MFRIYLRTSAIPELAPFDKRERRMLELSALMTLEREHRIVGALPPCLSVLGALLASVGVSLIVHRGFPLDGDQIMQAVLSTMAGATIGHFSAIVWEGFCSFQCFVVTSDAWLSDAAFFLISSVEGNS